ncbi:MULTISPECIES: K(+)-transporting ATPase subunit F [Burkholderia]|uniref:K(+)-transporting ATPase subunit F n=1 Tax=Burkholderia TaxID=32008 RepID=UPI00190F1494|nr:MULTISPECIES: K(+)-transporting ATPase subunit F [Burkholderia]
MYRLADRLKRTHKNAVRSGLRLYSFFIPRKEIEHRFDTRISTLSQPVRQMCTGGVIRGRADAARPRCADDRAALPRIRIKGKAMLWITGALSLALFAYLFHALIKPERY